MLCHFFYEILSHNGTPVKFGGKFNSNSPIPFPARSAGKFFTKEILNKKIWLLSPPTHKFINCLTNFEPQKLPPPLEVYVCVGGGGVNLNRLVILLCMFFQKLFNGPNDFSVLLFPFNQISLIFSSSFLVSSFDSFFSLKCCYY